MDAEPDKAVHQEKVPERDIGAERFRLYAALGHDLSASGETCPKARFFAHLRMENRGISCDPSACGGRKCGHLLGR